jgi:hypothetical protein
MPTTRCQSIRAKDQFLIPFIDTLIMDPNFHGPGRSESGPDPAEEPDRLCVL